MREQLLGSSSTGNFQKQSKITSHSWGLTVHVHNIRMDTALPTELSIFSSNSAGKIFQLQNKQNRYILQFCYLQILLLGQLASYRLQVQSSWVQIFNQFTINYVGLLEETLHWTQSSMYSLDCQKTKILLYISLIRTLKGFGPTTTRTRGNYYIIILLLSRECDRPVRL